MKILFYCMIFSLVVHCTLGQSILRIDGSKITAAQLENKTQELMKLAEVSGVAIAVFNNNQPVYSHAFGKADVQKNNPFLTTSYVCTASFAKMVFAYNVMQLVDEKVLDLDKPLVKYLSKPIHEYMIYNWIGGYQDLKTDERHKKITARMCLTHTTGMPNWRWMTSDKKLTLQFEPGSRYSYSGEGIHFLQFVIEQITGETYESIAQKKVFIPLKMTHSSFIWQPAFETNYSYAHDEEGKAYEVAKWPEANAAGSMVTTLDDFILFYTALINGKGLSKKSFNEMTKLQVRIKSQRQFGPLSKIDGNDNDDIELGYGLGVGLMNTAAGQAFFKEGHNDGMGLYSICYMDKKIAIVIMTNNDHGESIFKELLEYSIGDIYTPWKWENYIPYH